MAPRRASELFLAKHREMPAVRVTLYGALAATGKGHLTDKAIEQVFAGKKVEILWKPKEVLPFHPNGLLFEALDGSGAVSDSWLTFSTGGGALSDDDATQDEIYPHDRMEDILAHLEKSGQTLWEYVAEVEGEGIWSFLEEAWIVMKEAIELGLHAEGLLPGPLHVQRKASVYHTRSTGFTGTLKKKTDLFSYALAVAEQNAGGGKIVTAPTCGSCGVIPAVLFHVMTNYEMAEDRIIRSLATAGLIGSLVRRNASISGAKVGCQGEIGTACAMAAAAGTQLFGGTPRQIEYAAETGMEHHLGLTCDPVGGYVQIPCIERNAFAAARALDASAFAILSDGEHRISFDDVIQTMKNTGKDLSEKYKETSKGGLATVIDQKKKQ
jgi:L-serine dehydratase